MSLNTQPRPTYRQDLFVTDKSIRRVSIVLTPTEHALLDVRAKALNLSRGTVAHDLVMSSLHNKE